MAVVARIEERPWLDELNDEQRAAATHAGGPLLILAGAGTGQDDDAVRPGGVARQQGVPAERILLLTFTRRAAREMLQRARGPCRPRRVLGGTFHSVAHRLVRRHAPRSACRRVRRAGRGRRRRRDRPGPPGARARAGQDAASRARGRCWTSTRARSTHSSRCRAWSTSTSRGASDHREAIAALFKAYTARKRALGVIDLDDLLLYWRALARRRADRAAAGGGVRPRLVDEYQDVNALQVDIVRALGATGRRHGRRRRLPGHLRLPPARPSTSSTSRRTSPARGRTLERNYRSTQPMLDVANAVAAQAARASRSGCGPTAPAARARA